MLTRRTALVLTLLFAVTTQAAELTPPPLLDARPAPQLELTARPERRPGKGLLIAGLSTFGVSYLISVLLTAERVGAIAFVPVAGPALSTAALSGPRWAENPWNALIVGALTTAQVTGVALSVIGLVVATPPKTSSGPRVTFLPGAAGAPVGASLAGHF